MTTLIDGAGLTDAPVPPKVYVRALGIEGYLIPEENRDGLLRALQVAPPDADAGLTVYTGPGAVRYWQGAPVTVRVVVVPGEEEIPSSARREGLAWALGLEGVSPSEASALAARAPTSKHSLAGAYLRAVARYGAWGAREVGDWDVGNWEWLGSSETRVRQAGGLPYEVVIVDNVVAFRRLSEALRDAVQFEEVIGLDIETDLEENFNARLVGCGFAFGASGHRGDKLEPSSEGEEVQRRHQDPVTFYLPLGGPLGEDAALSLLDLYFASEHTTPPFIAHNGKYDAAVLARALRPDAPVALLRKLLQRLAGDGLIAAYVLGRKDWHTDQPLPRDLKSMAERLFGVHMLHFKEMLALSGAEQSSAAPLEHIGPYCCADAYWGLKVCENQVAELGKYPRLQALYELVELPTVAITAEMEMLGMRLDYALLAKRRQEVTARVEVYRKYLERACVAAGYTLKVEKKMCPKHSRKKVDYVGCEHCDERGRVQVTLQFNPGSRLQVEAVLQGTFGLPRMASTEGGDASNDEPALLRLRQFTDNEDARDFITFLLAWRKDDKVRGTYLDGLWERKRRDSWQGEGWYVHPRFNQAVVPSGRYSSSDPNGQNIPLNQRDLFIA